MLTQAGGRGGKEVGGRKCEIKRQEVESENPETYPSLCPSVRPSGVAGSIFKPHTAGMNNKRLWGEIDAERCGHF